MKRLAVIEMLAFSSGSLPEQSLNAVAEDVTGLIIDRCGHWIASEQPDALVEGLVGFFTV